jgi:hypothetical protein
MTIKEQSLATKYLVCINNKDHPASLKLRKIYRVLSDARAARHGLVRVIDESGEDYLYPAAYFAPIKLPQLVARKVFAVAT